MFLSITPGKELPEVNLWEIDKVVHVVVYAILGFLLSLAFFRQSGDATKRLNSSLKALFIGALYGILIEVIQGNFIPDRYFDKFDILANIIGSLAGLLTGYFSTNRINKFKQ